jgi:hypothetical protein
VADEKQQPETDATEEVRKGEWALSDLVKRAILSGVGAVFMTEEGIRSYLGELKLPKEAAQFVLGQVARTKEDLFRVVTDEIRSFLESTQLDDVLRQVLTNISLEISTKVRFVDESKGLQPRAKASIKVKRNRKKKAEAQADED